ncbi:MAG: alpha/beta fold hydrolase [Proteobacteria bacterium]|nr:alpha/beta fold hydrolase [Pseudomonadota bacterium]MBU1738432.1 alpha/beta fold hydrolase [Pseudomonadota bacterium]
MKNRSHFLILLLLIILPGCNEEVPGLKPSGLNSAFTLTPDSDFRTYIRHYRQIIEGSRIDLDGPDREKIIEANLPFEMVPEENGKPVNGILLIHGLFDSPYHMRDLGRHFRERGFLVRAILLPGHGTVPGDQTEVTMEEWVKATEYGVSSLKREVDRVFIGGFSTGGALAVLHALKNPDGVAGLFLFSPCLKVNTGFDRLAGTLSTFKTWLITRKSVDYARYESFAANSAAQVYLLTREIASLSAENRLTLPAFTVLSREDRTVDSEFTIDFFMKKIPSPESRLLIYGDKRTNSFSDPRITVSAVGGTSANILSSAHTAITIPPTDTHYGANGDYLNCLHYFFSSAKSEECRTGENIPYGEITRHHLAKGTMRRLTWNPKYREMLAGIDDFLTNLPDGRVKSEE